MSEENKTNGLQRPIEVDEATKNQLKDLVKKLYPISGHATEEQTVDTDNSNTNKLATPGLQRPIEVDEATKNQLKDLVKKLYPISGHATEEQTVDTDNSNTNKLAALRKKLAHNIDETLGTNLEEQKLPKPLKKIEKAVSDKLFGKVKE